MQLSFNLVDFILFAFALQGFVISGLLFYSSKNIVSNRWLGVLVFIISESTIMMELDYSGAWGSHPIFQLIMPPLMLAIGPVIYFYTRSLIFPSLKFTFRNRLHFVPVLLGLKHQFICLFYICGIFYIPFVQKIYFMPSVQTFLFDGFPLATLLSLVSVMSYSIFTYATIIRYQKGIELSANKANDLAWIKNMLHCFFVIAGIWLLLFVTDTVFPKHVFGVWDHYILYFPAIGFVYLLGMAAWRRQTQMSPTEIAEYKQKPAKAYYTDADAYMLQLNQLMARKQLYLNPLLKVEDVAMNLSIPEKALSSLLNQHLGKNFNDFVNEYRIAEVKLRLADAANSNFTIAAIAFDCGFNSLATFQRVFKQFTGITPGKFQRDCFSPQMVVK